MGGDWKTIPANEFCNSVRDGTHDSPKQTKNGFYLVTSRHITSNRVELENAYKISEDDFITVNKRSKVDKWDVLITMIGTVGEPCLIKKEPNFAIKNIGLFKSKGELEGKWLYYYLLSPGAQRLIRTYSRGSTQQYIPLGALREFPVAVPCDRVEMDAITRILGSLDDKIELNRRMNETLEAMARAIFKSWFVDFLPVRAKQSARTQTGDPVRAKADLPAEASAQAGGRPTGLPDDIAALFPDSFRDSELGEIPTGWEVGVVSDLGNVICGKTPPTKDPENYGGDIPFITIPDMHGKIFVTQTGKYLSTKGANTQRNKYLPAHSICVSCIATPGLVIMTTERSQTNQQINSVIPKNEQSSYYCYQVLNRLGDQIRAGGSGGSVLLNLNKTLFSNIKILMPDGKTIESYQWVVEPIFQRVLQNQRESASLSSLRDTLLPKLISGELRLPAAAIEDLAAQAGVPDAEKFMEPACAGTADREVGG